MENYSCIVLLQALSYMYVWGEPSCKARSLFTSSGLESRSLEDFET